MPSPKKSPKKAAAVSTGFHVKWQPLIVIVFIYTAFGFFLEKGRVFEPAVIQGQLRFERFRMLKMFLLALTFSHLSMVAVDWLNPAMWHAVETSCIKTHAQRGLLAVGAGSLLLGTGMALAGACPGTIYSQLGAGLGSPWFVFGGALVGTWLFSVVEMAVFVPFVKDRARLKRPSLRQHFDDASYRKVALITAAAIAGVVAVLYQFENVDIVGMEQLIFRDRLVFAHAWPAYLSGACVGLLNLPSIWLLGSPIGSSSNFIGLLAPLTRIPTISKLIPVDSEIGRSGFPSQQSYQRIVAVLSSVLGGYLSASLSDTWGTSEDLFSQSHQLIHQDYGRLQAFVGGVLLLFGARVAGGCTSGQAISGLATGAVNSWFAAAGFFAGGIFVSNTLLQAK